MKALDCCAGAGGLSLGMQRAGFDVLGIELDHDACETHRANVGPCDQASLWDWHPAQSYDVVGGGVPCQPHSAASGASRKGTEDPRGQLYKPFLRIAQEANSRVVFIENVRGLLSSPSATHKTAFAELCAAIKLAGWPFVKWRVLDAVDYGTPQFRRRVFVVGFRNESDCDRFAWPMPTHLPSPLLGTPWITVRQALGLSGDYKRGLIDGADWRSPQGARMLNVDQPATTVGATNAELLAALDRPSPTVITSEADAGLRVLPKTKRRKAADTLNHALTAHAPSCAGVLDTPSTTVDTTGTLSRRGRKGESNKDGAVRISVEQLAILQGFPRDFVFHGRTKETRHRQIGNAVPPQLAEAVAKAIRTALETR